MIAGALLGVVGMTVIHFVSYGLNYIFTFSTFEVLSVAIAISLSYICEYLSLYFTEIIYPYAWVRIDKGFLFLSGTICCSYGYAFGKMFELNSNLSFFGSSNALLVMVVIIIATLSNLVYCYKKSGKPVITF